MKKIRLKKGTKIKCPYCKRELEWDVSIDIGTKAMIKNYFKDVNFNLGLGKKVTK